MTGHSSTGESCWTPISQPSACPELHPGQTGVARPTGAPHTSPRDPWGALLHSASEGTPTPVRALEACARHDCSPGPGSARAAQAWLHQKAAEGGIGSPWKPRSSCPRAGTASPNGERGRRPMSWRASCDERQLGQAPRLVTYGLVPIQPAFSLMSVPSFTSSTTPSSRDGSVRSVELSEQCSLESQRARAWLSRFSGEEAEASAGSEANARRELLVREEQRLFDEMNRSLCGVEFTEHLTELEMGGADGLNPLSSSADSLACFSPSHLPSPLAGASPLATPLRQLRPSAARSGGPGTIPSTPTSLGMCAGDMPSPEPLPVQSASDFFESSNDAETWLLAGAESALRRTPSPAPGWEAAQLADPRTPLSTVVAKLWRDEDGSWRLQGTLTPGLAVPAADARAGSPAALPLASPKARGWQSPPADAPPLSRCCPRASPPRSQARLFPQSHPLLWMDGAVAGVDAGSGPVSASTRGLWGAVVGALRLVLSWTHAPPPVAALRVGTTSPLLRRPVGLSEMALLQRHAPERACAGSPCPLCALSPPQKVPADGSPDSPSSPSSGFVSCFSDALERASCASSAYWSAPEELAAGALDEDDDAPTLEDVAQCLRGTSTSGQGPGRASASGLAASSAPACSEVGAAGTWALEARLMSPLMSAVHALDGDWLTSTPR